MKDPFYRHSQFELFPGAVGPTVDKGHSRVFSRTLTVSIENFFVLAVVLIMGLVVAFSLGVERGKKVGLQQSPSSIKTTEISGLMQEQEVYAQVNPQAQIQSERPSVAVIRKESFENKPEIKMGSLAALKAIQIDVKKELDISNEKLYTVQVASFKEVEYAQKEAAGLKDKGYEIFVLPKGKYSIVCVGKFAQEGEARTVSQRFKKQYKDCLIRSL